MTDDIGLPESFQTHRFPVRASFNQTYYVLPFGDVHRFAPLCAEDRWLEFLQWAKSKPRAYFIGMGDYLELLSGSERKFVNEQNLHESTMEHLEEHYDKLIDQFAREIGFMKGRLVGMLEGNHHVRFQSGETSTQRLCRKLGCKYLGNTAFIKMVFRQGKSEIPVVIFASHGTSAGGRTASGGFRQLESAENVAEADLYLMGHNHQKGALPFARLHLTDFHGQMKVVQRKGFYVRTGSFLKGYAPGCKSYSANKLMRPYDLGCCKVELTPTRKRGGGIDVVSMDIHVSV